MQLIIKVSNPKGGELFKFASKTAIPNNNTTRYL